MLRTSVPHATLLGGLGKIEDSPITIIRDWGRETAVYLLASRDMVEENIYLNW
jgi:hypothetical protein